MKKQIINVIIFVIGIYLIINLSKDIFRLLSMSDQLQEAEKKLVLAEKEHQDLLNKKDYWSSTDFVEEEARNKLNMNRPGETVVVLPKDLGQGKSLSNDRPGVIDPNWKKWLDIFR
jgi:cell division protein FtsB